MGRAVAVRHGEFQIQKHITVVENNIPGQSMTIPTNKIWVVIIITWFGLWQIGP